ncbi:MAG: hypothetical protein M1839_003690 [Geoglossum umbratile]|nr:MAG: hypothetical protein M1839_003690 [Geoglossum umbratile]
MGTYRVEISGNSRAGCKNTACKTQNIKIQKGELRFGSLVEIGGHQSWSWKHWGCVTPAQIQGVKDSIDDDLDSLDGYDGVSPEMQEKIRNAIEQGHVADEDWSGDAELNRPGKKGMHKRASKKEDREAHGDGDEDAGKTDAKPANKKRGRSKKDAGDEEEPAVTKRSKTEPKKVKVTVTVTDNIANDEEDKDEEEHAPKKGKASGKKTNAARNDIQASDSHAPAARKTRSGGKYKSAPAVADESESEVDEEPSPKAAASRKKADKGGKDKPAPKVRAKANGKASPIPKGRKAAPKSAERVEDSDDGDVEGPAEPKKTREPKPETKAKDEGSTKAATTKEKK